MLMGDSWSKTILRVVTPNAMSTILEVFSYYFVNAMVTVSAVAFLAGARTMMVLTTKIKELQYYNKFNEVFVLSLLILVTNLVAKAIPALAAAWKRMKEETEDGNCKETDLQTGRSSDGSRCAGIFGSICSRMLFEEASRL